MVTRRHVLAATGIAVGSAGCAGALGSEGDDEESTTDADSVRLGEVHVQNNHDEDHEVQLAIEADDEVLHLGTYSLGTDARNEHITGDWTDTADSYRVHARLDDGEVQTVDVSEDVGEANDCASVLIRIDPAGEFGIWHGPCE
ncbi:MAG: hypothetical protein PPP58_09435 [Natronomonas sp.]